MFPGIVGKNLIGAPLLDDQIVLLPGGQDGEDITHLWSLPVKREVI